MIDSNENIYTDQNLINSVLAGNNAAFGLIIKKTEGLVAQIIFKMIDNAEDRKDIAQDTYLKIFKNLSKFKFQSKMSTWIAQIAYNTCLNYLAKKKLVLPDTLHDEETTDEDAIGQVSSNSSESVQEMSIFQKQQTEILQAEIEKLAPVYKTLIILYHTEGLSYQEIMQITGLPDGTVKNYLFRARKLIKDSLLRKYKKEEL